MPVEDVGEDAPDLGDGALVGLARVQGVGREGAEAGAPILNELTFKMGGTRR